MSRNSPDVQHSRIHKSATTCATVTSSRRVQTRNIELVV